MVKYNYNNFQSSLQTINDEERSEKCKLIIKLAEEIRENLEKNPKRNADQQLHDTIREIGIMLKAFKP